MSDEIKQTLERILDRLDTIERILKSEEKEETFTAYDPWLYPGDETPQPYVPTFGGFTECSKCGMIFEGMTNYNCPDNNCPTFFKAT